MTKNTILPFKNTRNFLNQRAKTQKGGQNIENESEKPLRLESNLARNRALSSNMEKIALRRLDELERKAPQAIRKIKEDFFNVSNHMYNLAYAIQSVENTLQPKNTNANHSKKRTQTNGKNQETQEKEQKKRIRKMKEEFFQTSTGLVSLAQSIDTVADIMPGKNGPGNATNMNRYVRRAKNNENANAKNKNNKNNRTKNENE
jgi:hypothetical protein